VAWGGGGGPVGGGGGGGDFRRGGRRVCGAGCIGRRASGGIVAVEAWEVGVGAEQKLAKVGGDISLWHFLLRCKLSARGEFSALVGSQIA
jgi:hypothetical protein